MATGQSPNTPSELDELVAALDAEEMEWRNAGMSVNGVQINQFVLNAKLIAMERYLTEAFPGSEDRRNFILKQVILEEMRTIRGQIGEQVKEQLAAAKLQALKEGRLGSQDPPLQ